MGKSQKLELLLEKEQAKDFFRDLATYLEEGRPLDEYGIDLSGHKKIKISLFEEDEHLALKIKVKDFGHRQERDVSEELQGSLKIKEKNVGTRQERNGREEQHGFLKIKEKDVGNREKRNSRKEQYGSLKKRMKTYFKAIGQAGTAGAMPADELISTFLADSRSMVSYPGKGDEFYPAYMDACEALQQAFDQKDPTALHDACRALARCMAECHARYK